MKKIVVLFSILAVFSITALADIPPMPRPTPRPQAGPAGPKSEAEMRVGVNSVLDKAVLRIPRNVINDLNVPVAQNAQQTTAAFGNNANQSLIGGLFLSLGIIAGGIWLFRAKPLGNGLKVAAGLLLATIVGSSATIVLANIAPPPLRGLNSSLLNNQAQRNLRGTVGDVTVVIAEDGDNQVTLYLPKDKNSKGDE